MMICIEASRGYQLYSLNNWAKTITKPLATARPQGYVVSSSEGIYRNNKALGVIAKSECPLSYSSQAHKLS